MHVNSDQKRLLLPCFHYCRLPFYRLKADDGKLYIRLFLRYIKEKWAFNSHSRFVRLK